MQKIIDQFKIDIEKVEGIIEDKIIKYVKPYEEVDAFALDWINPLRVDKQLSIEKSKAKVIICDESIFYNDTLKHQNKLLLVAKNPKLLLIKIIESYFAKSQDKGIHPTAVIHKQAKLGENVSIGPNCVIGENVKIGNGTTLCGNNFIDADVTIGDNVILQAGVIVGNEGHNFVRDENNACVRFPHIGGVIIGNDIEIGGNSFVSRGVLSDTTIADGTKIAQSVYIGANAIIGKCCAIRANVIILGSVKIGNYTVIAPSATVRDHRSIGDNAVVGMGAVVLKDIDSNETWVGNPAKKIK